MNEPPEPSVLERLPWPAVADSIFGELDAAGVIALSTCCHTVREAVWNDDGFWHRNFVRCFGDYLPRRLVRWRSAFFATQSLGLSGTSSAPVQRQEHRGLIAKVKAVEKKVMAALTDRGQQQQQAESATSTASQTGWGTILIGVLGVRGSGKSRMLRCGAVSASFPLCFNLTAKMKASPILARARFASDQVQRRMLLQAGRFATAVHGLCSRHGPSAGRIAAGPLSLGCLHGRFRGQHGGARMGARTSPRCDRRDHPAPPQQPQNRRAHPGDDSCVHNRRERAPPHSVRDR